MKRIVSLLLLLAFALRGAEQMVSLAPIEQRLEKILDTCLENPDRYAELVGRECRSFPEAELFSYTFPAYAYINLGLSEPDKRVHCAAQTKKLIVLTLQSALSHLKPNDFDLMQLKTYEKQATWMGHMALLLGAYRLISEDSTYDKLRLHLISLLVDGLKAENGLPIMSYPTYAWTVDTIPCLLAIRINDQVTGRDNANLLISRHLGWLRGKGLHPDYGLPYSEYDMLKRNGMAAPRGCDLSYRFCFLPHMAPTFSKELYATYKQQFFRELGDLAGFREYPKDLNLQADIDSGPIVMGMGLSASGLGLSAAKANHDYTTYNKLARVLLQIDDIKALFLLAGAEQMQRLLPEIKSQYVTGFLYGDAILFYCVTWTSWSPQKTDL